MKILYPDIKKYLIHDKGIEEISKALFQLGHENEYENETINIEFTPNKGDCLSVMGLTRDLNSLFETNIEIELYNDIIEELDFNFSNTVPDFCPRISFLKIETKNQSNKYKPYLENYFKNLNITKNNFFTDISNYLLYEIGQPTHCYDFNKIQDGISLNSTSASSEFNTLTGKKIDLDAGEMVFTNNNNIINLAGIMGGEQTKCQNTTDTVLVECAFFSPDKIMGKSVKYDLLTDAAYRFERGVDPNIQEFALRRFIKIVDDHADILKISMNTYQYKDFSLKKLPCNFTKINSILGTDFEDDYIIKILDNLGFLIKEEITIPSWRHDIESINDLAEEVARVYGYNNIKRVELKLDPINSEKLVESKNFKIRNFLVDNGFSEIINDPFVGDYSKKSVEVDNPLDSNRKFLRLNVIGSLIKNLDYNEKRQKESIKFFEISDIYTNDDIARPKSLLSIIVSGRVNNNYLDFNKKLDHQYLYNILEQLGIEHADIKEVQREKINSKIKNKIFYVEVELDNVNVNSIQAFNKHEYIFNKFKSVSEFPSSYRDISISINNKNILSNVVDMVFNQKIKNLKDLFIFDFYENKDKNIYKVGFRFIFQSKEKTLEDKEIDAEMSKIFNTLLEVDGVSIPGIK